MYKLHNIFLKTKLIFIKLCAFIKHIMDYYIIEISSHTELIIYAEIIKPFIY
jgi:hypothetical protein